MCNSKIVTWLVTAAMCLAGLSLTLQVSAQSVGLAEPVTAGQSNDDCLGCHGKQSFKHASANGSVRPLHVMPEMFQKSVHGQRNCIDCHADITEIPHQTGVTHDVNCVNCHDALWTAALEQNTSQEHARLGKVVEQIDHYMKSIHSQPNRATQSGPNANCYDCHNPHYIYPKGTAERREWRLNVPNTCGVCHSSELEVYAASVHGKAVLEDKNPDAAICADCHTTHDVTNPGADDAKLVITKNCGSCHAESLETYTETYHGQVNTLGYAYTAKCFDCHGSHDIHSIDDSNSSVSPENRLETCQQCHAGATAGFATFEPHGTSGNFAKYPYIWIASKLLLLMIAGMFVFFWSHAALWLNREYKERKERKFQSYIRTDELLDGKFAGKYYQRFSATWRVAHLLFGISLMMLALTGMSVLFADSHWAPVVMHWLGGPQVAAVIHRTFAVLFGVIFFMHLIYFVIHLVLNRSTFEWFGPNSLAPRKQDLLDIVSMFKWFTGLGPKPVFDRWTYWQKFDYWAPFAAVVTIGTCGVMLWIPNVTAQFLPGWVFNVATVFHGELAVLAVLFLFTVHIFNNHFRPEKFPLDIVMFTGSMPVEEFKRTHRIEYNRLLASGELEKHLVDVPTRPLTLSSKLLGFILIAFSLLLLVLILNGMLGS